MEFEKSRVFTVLNADELSQGDVVFAADSLAGIKSFNASFVVTIECILNEKYSSRFRDSEGSDWALVYLIAKHDDPYKEFKKAQAEGKEVWLRGAGDNWSSNKTNCQDWLFRDSPERYSLVPPDVVSWKDFKLGDKVAHKCVMQIVDAIDSRNDFMHIHLSDSGWLNDITDLQDVKKLEA